VPVHRGDHNPNHIAAARKGTAIRSSLESSDAARPAASKNVSRTTFSQFGNIFMYISGLKVWHNPNRINAGQRLYTDACTPHFYLVTQQIPGVRDV
jgi:hypothetical protein